MGTYSCRGCKLREVGCHSTCEDYIAVKKEHDIHMQNKYKENELAVTATKTKRSMAQRLRKRT